MTMTKVRINFTLVGKSNMWKRNLPKGSSLDFTNSDTLEYVKDTVESHFGNRALVVVNENKLAADVTYPNFYAAGWFVSEGDNPSEIVIVDHGHTMDAARKAMMDSIAVVDWNSFSKRI